MRGTSSNVFDFGGTPPSRIASLSSMTKWSMVSSKSVKCIIIKSEFSVLFNAVYYFEKFIEISDNFGGKVVCGSFHLR